MIMRQLPSSMDGTCSVEQEHGHVEVKTKRKEVNLEDHIGLQIDFVSLCSGRHCVLHGTVCPFQKYLWLP